MGGGAPGMDDPLGNALVVEVGDLLPEMEVLQERRPPLRGLEAVLIVLDAKPLIGGQRLTEGVRAIAREIFELRVGRRVELCFVPCQPRSPTSSRRDSLASAAPTASFTCRRSSGGGSTAGKPSDWIHSSRAQPMLW